MDDEEGRKILEAMKAARGPFIYDGLLFPPMPGIYPDPAKKFIEINDMECRDSDVFLCSFPKAGTNWAHEALGMLLHQSTDYNLVHPKNSFLEVLIDKNKDQESPRLFFTHLPFRYLPEQLRSGNGRIILVQRNPKDLHVSYYNFNKGKENTMGKEKTWNDFFEETLIRGEGELYGGWFTYTQEWEKETSNLINILPIYYEDMKKDLSGEVMKIAEFLGISCSMELAQNISDKCSFDNLKKNRHDPSKLINKPGVDTSLFRRGQVGDWKNWFTVSQDERFDELYNEKMKDSKIQFTYEL